MIGHERSGTLEVFFSFSVKMNNNDGYVGTGNGSLTVTMTNGIISNYNISGAGNGITIGGAANASGCSIDSFKITSIKWIPD